MNNGEKVMAKRGTMCNNRDVMNNNGNVMNNSEKVMIDSGTMCNNRDVMNNKGNVMNNSEKVMIDSGTMCNNGDVMNNNGNVMNNNATMCNNNESVLSNTGTVFNIQRFSTSDGPGIRTVVFLKGCPLNCAWCHNPESKSVKTEIFYKKELCIGCRACGTVCKMHSHCFEPDHRFDRSRCMDCTDCTKVCPTKALEACGETKTVSQVMDEVLRDKPFYEESGGGITVSGGEPLMQYAFTHSLLGMAKSHGLHTAIETSGFSNMDFGKLHAVTDLWLYDIKLFPEEEHKKYTGVSNRIIFHNLHMLDDMGADIVLRCPILPGINMCEEHFENLSRLAGELKNVSAIHLEPYHPLGISKAEQLNKKQTYQNDKFLEASELTDYLQKLRLQTHVEVVIA